MLRRKKCNQYAVIDRSVDILFENKVVAILLTGIILLYNVLVIYSMYVFISYVVLCKFYTQK